MENKTFIDSKKFTDITKNISIDAAKCYLDSTIMDYLKNTPKSNIGKKLGSCLNNVCKSSDLHKNHAANDLPVSLNSLCASIKIVDDTASKELKIK